MSLENNIKLSDCVANFLIEKKLKNVFAISGGASLHLIHSIVDNPKLNCICTHHEQAATIAADGYARTNSYMGVVVTTSGPGATNTITGICCSYYDSIPLLVITGQVSTFRMTGDTGVRQVGFQETPITEIVRPIVKYSYQIKDPNEILYQLDKAFHIASSGRKGPVLIDIPDNLQRSLINPKKLRRYYPREKIIVSEENLENNISKINSLIKSSSRPVLIGGWGINLSDTRKNFQKFVEDTGIPTVLTWGGCDLIQNDHPLYIGTFGTHGMRHANFAVQNADLIIALGTRLDTKSTGSPITTFARKAKKVILDIDKNELNKFIKFGLDFDLLIHADLKDFFRISKIYNPNKENLKSWIIKINKWEALFENYKNKKISEKYIDIDFFYKSISKIFSKNIRIFIDTGCSIAWMMQKFKPKKGQRIFHDFNNTAMGWALPASIGSYFANPNNPIVAFIGDGSFMMSLQELATVMHHKIPIKIFVINNNGYSMIKQTQDQWLNSNYYASSSEGGISFPDFEKIASSFKLNYFELSSNKNIDLILEKILTSDSPTLCNVKISPEERVLPQVKFGRPNEDMEPLLPREIFNKEMLIDPIT